ncbi:hypothetical protein GTW40_27685 [Streptomyces sp. SID4985]|uniref:hypothetical protein n=1 Tax=Streptomyces sp. SID4985 TaxID=2690292 RepID=UPI00136EBC38|nr:hypothetical protein [Streptomyces sp. SID4985]MYQ48769.1 hypothetical protein [Streptomyces sp. SID4985]
MSQWSVGDRVTPVGDSDHPEDPIGKVVMITAYGEVIVNFPQAGPEVYAPDELVPAPPEDGPHEVENSPD